MFQYCRSLQEVHIFTLQQLQIQDQLYFAMMNFVDAHPLASCDAGGKGRTVLMVADQTIPNDVKPLFQVHVHRPDLDHLLVHPTKVMSTITNISNVNIQHRWTGLQLQSSDFSLLLSPILDKSMNPSQSSWLQEILQANWVAKTGTFSIMIAK